MRRTVAKSGAAAATTSVTARLDVKKLEAANAETAAAVKATKAKAMEAKAKVEETQAEVEVGETGTTTAGNPTKDAISGATRTTSTAGGDAI